MGMDGELKTFEGLLKLMPSGWEQKARELGALKRSREIRDAKDLLLVNFPCLTGTPSFSRTAAVLRLEGTIHLTRNAACERIEKSGKWLKWLCGNIFRGGGLRGGEKPQWLADRRVCLTGASDEPVHGSKKADYQEEARKEYRRLLRKGDKECPHGEEKPPGRRGREAKPKSRNLPGRLMEREDDVLRFMTGKEVPFTNNQAERDLRMMKVQQKIPGCFRAWEGAKTYCLIRGYISTCLKQGLTASEAVKLIFQNKLPDFVAL
jgi:hypothetical protein